LQVVVDRRHAMRVVPAQHALDRLGEADLGRQPNSPSCGPGRERRPALSGPHGDRHRLGQGHAQMGGDRVEYFLDRMARRSTR
jgi:hypothetical protein